MIMAQEQSILKGRQQFERMAESVREAVLEGRSIHGVERDLWAGLLALGHALLESYVAGQGTGDLGATLEAPGREGGHEGATLRRLGPLHDRRYVSVFGELNIRRHVYGTRESQKHELAPLDARLGLPEGEFSYLLQDWDQSLCVKGSYAESRSVVKKMLGLGQSVRSLEHMNRSMAAGVEAFRQSLPPPPAAEEAEILVLTGDCKGVPMRRDAGKGEAGKGEAEPAAGADPGQSRRHKRRKKGEKANKKRMACVGSVYTIKPFVRTAGDVVDEVMREKAQATRPRPQHKQVRVELTREVDGQQVNAKDRIFGWFKQQAQARNPAPAAPGPSTKAGAKAKAVVCVMDGERALWKRLLACLVGVVCILDLYHMMERLWEAAHCFHPEGSVEAEQFVTERLERILRGEAGRVIGGLRQMATKRGLRGSKLKRLRAAANYLHNNRRSMHYDQYLAAGYPIGSGVAEGACGHVVKDRMELTGMRWRVPTAQAMLDLRCTYVNEQWDDFQSYRIDQETRRLYPCREAVCSAWPQGKAA